MTNNNITWIKIKNNIDLPGHHGIFWFLDKEMNIPELLIYQLPFRNKERDIKQQWFIDRYSYWAYPVKPDILPGDNETMQVCDAKN